MAEVTDDMIRATRAHDLDKHRRLAVRAKILNARIRASLHELAEVEEELARIEARYPALMLKHDKPVTLKEVRDDAVPAEPDHR